jgi:hypothetical protein
MPTSRRKLIEQCAAARRIKKRFGLASAAQYLIEEKFCNFLAAGDRDPEIARDIPAFANEIKRLFTTEEIREHLGRRRLPRIREALQL